MWEREYTRLYQKDNYICPSGDQWLKSTQSTLNAWGIATSYRVTTFYVYYHNGSVRDIIHSIYHKKMSTSSHTRSVVSYTYEKGYKLKSFERVHVHKQGVC